jgi:hypothetical protein
LENPEMTSRVEKYLPPERSAILGRVVRVTIDDNTEDPCRRHGDAAVTVLGVHFWVHLSDLGSLRKIHGADGRPVDRCGSVTLAASRCTGA